ncbi:hypothetical protein ACRS64_26970 [Pseudomonas aeruginosa]|uniref:hypothetical protein n=1 Tax=Pseudomonas aeruginosa TaxID=287 RepID=UPI003DA79367
MALLETLGPPAEAIRQRGVAEAMFQRRKTFFRRDGVVAAQARPRCGACSNASRRGGGATTPRRRDRAALAPWFRRAGTVVSGSALSCSTNRQSLEARRVLAGERPAARFSTALHWLLPAPELAGLYAQAGQPSPRRRR